MPQKSIKTAAITGLAVILTAIGTTLCTQKCSESSSKRNVVDLENGPTLRTIGNDERTYWELEGNFGWIARRKVSREALEGTREIGGPLDDLEKIIIEQNGTRINFRTTSDKSREGQIEAYGEPKYSPIKLDWKGSYDEGEFEAMTSYYDKWAELNHIFRLVGKLDGEKGQIVGTLYDNIKATIDGEEYNNTSEELFYLQMDSY